MKMLLIIKSYVSVDNSNVISSDDEVDENVDIDDKIVDDIFDDELKKTENGNPVFKSEI